MRNFCIIALVLLSNCLLAQPPVDSLVQLGIQFHDNGQYDKAIELYQKALEIDPASPLTNYEIALTYMHTKDYANSIKHSDIVIEQKGQNLLQAYVTKGSCLDYLGKTDESIRLFEEGIRKFGDHHLLYYNLGFNYYRLKNYEKAQEIFTKAVKANPAHASSHLLLGFTMEDLDQKVQSLLCLHYFLLLEPNSERAKTAFNSLRKQFRGNVKVNKDNPTNININILLNSDQKDSEFGAAELMISMLEASKSLEENEGKTDDELFTENSASFFKMLGELNKKKNKGLWWDFYIPFFDKLAQSGNMDAYCHYISQSSNDTAMEWLQNNRSKTEQLEAWLKENPAHLQ